MADPGAHLIVAVSGRALALAARRSGHRPLVLDLFGDTDTRAAALASRTIPGDLAAGFDAGALLAAADQLAPADRDPPIGVVYGAGLEARPDLIARLAQGRRLSGNSPRTVAAVKDPERFFDRLDELGLPHPATALAPPADRSGWLVKSIGGAGGTHIGPAPAGPRRSGRYFQTRVAGRAVAIAFLADGARAQVVGITEQWAAPSAASPHRFGGAAFPAEIDAPLARRLAAAVGAVAAGFGLVGLNGLDAMVAGDRFWILEVNPRPGASLDVLDRDDPSGLFARHLAACAGTLAGDWRAPATAAAMAVVYAERACRAPRETRWPAWVADRPAPGALIPADAPICTVLAKAATTEMARAAALRRVRAVLAHVSPVEHVSAHAS